MVSQSAMDWQREGQWLEMALSAIHRAAVSVGSSRRELRDLRWQALDLSKQACGCVALPVQEGGASGLEDFEECMSIVRPLTTAVDKPHIGHCVRMLREQGEHELAARLRRASTRRNAAAHPECRDLASDLRCWAKGSTIGQTPVELKLNSFVQANNEQHEACHAQQDSIDTQEHGNSTQTREQESTNDELENYCSTRCALEEKFKGPEEPPNEHGTSKHTEGELENYRSTKCEPAAKLTEVPERKSKNKKNDNKKEKLRQERMREQAKQLLDEAGSSECIATSGRAILGGKQTGTGHTEIGLAEFQVREAFNLFDEEGSGTIEPAAIGAAMLALGLDLMDPAIGFDQVMANLDGTAIGFDEFSGAITQMQKKGPP